MLDRLPALFTHIDMRMKKLTSEAFISKKKKKERKKKEKKRKEGPYVAVVASKPK